MDPIVTTFAILAVLLIGLALLYFLRHNTPRIKGPDTSLEELYAVHVAYLATLGERADVVGTGGGCTALAVGLNDTHSLLATNRWDGSLLRAIDPPEESCGGWNVGIYDQGDFIAMGFDPKFRKAVEAAFRSVETGRAVGFDSTEQKYIEAAFQPPLPRPFIYRLPRGPTAVRRTITHIRRTLS